MMRLCTVVDGLFGWQGRMMARAPSDYWLPVGLRTCIDWPLYPHEASYGVTEAGWALPCCPSDGYPYGNRILLCGGSSDLAAAFGLVGGPGAVGLPAPVDDLRTETRAVGW